MVWIWVVLIVAHYLLVVGILHQLLPGSDTVVLAWPILLWLGIVFAFARLIIAVIEYGFGEDM